MTILLYVLLYSNFFVLPSYSSSPPKDTTLTTGGDFKYFPAYKNSWGTLVLFSTWGFLGLSLLNVSILGFTLGNGSQRWWVQLLALSQTSSAGLGGSGKGPHRVEVAILPRVQPLWSRHCQAVVCGALRVRGSMTVNEERQIYCQVVPKAAPSLENCWRTLNRARLSVVQWKDTCPAKKPPLVE